MVKAIVEQVQHPGYMSFILLICMLGIGFGKWGELQGVQTAGELFALTNIFSMLQYLLPTIVTFITKGVMK